MLVFKSVELEEVHLTQAYNVFSQAKKCIYIQNSVSLPSIVEEENKK